MTLKNWALLLIALIFLTYLNWTGRAIVISGTVFLSWRSEPKWAWWPIHFSTIYIGIMAASFIRANWY